MNYLYPFAFVETHTEDNQNTFRENGRISFKKGCWTAVIVVKLPWAGSDTLYSNTRHICNDYIGC